MNETRDYVYKSIERRVMEELKKLEQESAEPKKAGRPCTVCKCPDRLHIDRMLLRGMPFTIISKIYNLSESALQRHFRNHVLKTAPTPEVLDLVHRVVATLEGPSVPCIPIECTKEETDNDFYTQEEVDSDECI